jgi:plasmid segregation protein ParM
MTVVGIDVGYGYTKAVSRSSNVTLPSSIGPAVAIKYHNDLLHNGRGLEIRRDGSAWFVGELARLQSPYVVSPKARDRDPRILVTLSLAALEELGIGNDDIDLVTGLPVSWYPDRETLIEALQCSHDYEVNNKKRTAHVRNVLVVPQPFGSFFQMLLTGEGRLPKETLPLTKQRVGIIDIGTLTTDFVLADGLRYVEPKSSSVQVAMHRVHELVQRGVAEMCGRELSPEDAELVVRERKVTVRDEILDVGSLVNSAAEAVAMEIVAEAQTLWGDGLDIHTVLVTGGGGEVFLEAVKGTYPHARLMSQPQIANADGFYRYGLRKFA